MVTTYLDNNASTALDPKVIEKIFPYHDQKYGNANSPHKMGASLHCDLDYASQQIYTALNASDEDNIVITSGATESINTVHKHFLFEFLKNPKKNTIITSPLDHPASKKSLEFMIEYGIKVITLPLVDDTICVKDFISAFDPDQCLLVTLNYVSHEFGVILPIQEIAEICATHNVPIHVDSTQAVGKIPLDFQKTPITFASFSGHKIHAPKGIGALYIQAPYTITPLLHGGKHMGGLRAGTLNISGIVGLGEAVALAYENFEEKDTYIRGLRKTIEDFLLSIPGCTIYAYDNPRNCNTCFFNIESIDHDYIVWHLNKHNICVGTGSACSTVQYNDKSDLINKTKGVRVSLSRFNTEKDVENFIQHMQKLL